MYAVLMVKSPPRKTDMCLIAELGRYELTVQRRAITALLKESLYA